MRRFLWYIIMPYSSLEGLNPKIICKERKRGNVNSIKSFSASCSQTFSLSLLLEWVNRNIQERQILRAFYCPPGGREEKGVDRIRFPRTKTILIGGLPPTLREGKVDLHINERDKHANKMLFPLPFSQPNDSLAITLV